MADGAMAYNGAKAYHDSKLCNVLFAREADRRWRTGGVSVRSFNPGLITDTGLFRAARKDNLVGTLLFSFVATNLAGFSVPVEVGGARLAYAATASEAEVLCSYAPTTLPLPTLPLPTYHLPLPTLPLPTYHLTTTDYLTITYHPSHHRLHLPPSNHLP